MVGGSDGSDDEIYLYNGSTTIQLTNNSTNDHEPQISANGYVVWQGSVDTDDEIFLHDGTGTTQLTNNSYNDNNPKINNAGSVVWDRDNGFDSEIFLATPFSPYDTNQDWIIGNFELLNAIDNWAAGSLGNFELLDLIDFWAAGCYHLDVSSGERKAGCP
jgi:hypothetical protein